MTKEERAIQYLKSFEPVSEPYYKKPFDIAKSGKDVMKWWLGEDINQITIEDYLKDIETL